MIGMKVSVNKTVSGISLGFTNNTRNIETCQYKKHRHLTHEVFQIIELHRRLASNSYEFGRMYRLFIPKAPGKVGLRPITIGVRTRSPLTELTSFPAPSRRQTLQFIRDFHNRLAWSHLLRLQVRR